MPLAAPKFPRFNDIVSPKTFEVASAPASARRVTGLFDGVLGGNAAALYQDAIEHPEKYDEQAVGLLTELVQGAKKRVDLEETDIRLLDRATLDFASYVKPPAQRKQPTSMTKSAKSVEFTEGPDEVPFDENDVPDGTQAYWWL